MMKRLLSYILLSLAKKQVNFQNYKLASMFINLAIKLYPSIHSYNLAGFLNIKTNQLNEALNYLNKSIDLFENIEAYVGMSDVMMLKENFEGAIQYSKKILEIDPKSEIANFGLVVSYTKMQKYDKAEKIALTIQDSKMYGLKVKIILIKIYLQQGKLNLAKDIIDAIGIKPETKNISIYYLAEYYYLKGEIAKAKEQIDIVKNMLKKDEEFIELKDRIYMEYFNEEKI